MNIKGIHKTSLVDYPGKICSIVFSGGCNLRCRYCHNPELARNSGEIAGISNDEVLDFVRKRKGLIDGVALSGGEPTMSTNLVSFLRSLREMGLSTKIDTNGLNPAVIERLLSLNLLDYIAVDVKTSPQKYGSLTGDTNAFPQVRRTIEVLKSAHVEFEIRTTCIPSYVTLDDLKSIGREIGPVPRYFLQQFVNSKTLDESLRSCVPYPVSTLREFQRYVRTFASICELRGV